MTFQRSPNHVATQALMRAVNAAMAPRCPLPVQGEPGTIKTILTEEVWAAFGVPLLQWHIKSTTEAQRGLRGYAAVSNLRDSQMAAINGGDHVNYIHNYIIQGML